MTKKLIITFLFLFATPSFAIKFSNQFCEFELPPKWQCNLEGAEWVCQSSDESKKREAIIVLAAKIKGDLDSLDRYQAYLQGPKIFTAPNGQSIKSSPVTTKVTPINGQNWVDSLHKESEVPGFYTRYFATVKQDIGVLVTYSIHQKKYQEYLPQFDAMVKSLKVFRKAGTGINQLAGGSLFNTNSQAISNSGLFNTQNQLPSTDSSADKKGKKKDTGDDSLLYLLVIAGAIGFYIYKKKKNG